MARVAETTKRTPGVPSAPASAALSDASGASSIMSAFSPADPVEKDKVLPLPRWLVRVYFIFPIVLYIPDGIFNFYVYTDGVATKQPNIVLQVGFFALWAFVSLGVVGMAYLLSVLAPWHWGQGHRLQALFCGLGVVVATGITTWNSLAFRSTTFKAFETDKWIWSVWPQLREAGVSVTMILVAVAPPFWGLFWAVVQPTQTGRSLRQIQESHAQKLLRTQQEAELKALRAEANAKVRAAQLRGMAATASAAREQAKQVFGRGGTAGSDEGTQQSAESDTSAQQSGSATSAVEAGTSSGAKVLQLPTFNPTAGREAVAGGRGSMTFHNHAAAAASPGVHASPGNPARAGLAQPALSFNADVADASGLPPSDAVTFAPRQPATLFAGDLATTGPLEMSDAEAMTGTSGPRRAVGRPGLGTLNRVLNEPPRIVQAIQAAVSELRGDGAKQIREREIVARVVEQLGVDEATAKSSVRKYMRETQRGTTRNS